MTYNDDPADWSPGRRLLEEWTANPTEEGKRASEALLDWLVNDTACGCCFHIEQDMAAKVDSALHDPESG